MDFIKAIEEFCSENEEVVTFYKNYSGRFMFGKQCIGISSDNIYQVLINMTEYLINEGFEDISYKLGTISSDQMGLGIIVYFPDLQYIE